MKVNKDLREVVNKIIDGLQNINADSNVNDVFWKVVRSKSYQDNWYSFKDLDDNNVRAVVRAYLKKLRR